MDTIGIIEDMSDEEKDEKYNKYMQEQYRQMEEVMGIEVKISMHILYREFYYYYIA